ncbi:MAG TPA: hydrogen gas-evolving membrane-bound hydrogenase subunit E, partial [Rubrobacteraceae bacterium]|nr:hydrogen gas-evolving membrane-bound hydrogenase subunit E [Rubrobacteraceae bacterium]
MSRRVRSGLFLVAAVVFGSLLIWGLLGLPAFGDYQGPYGIVLEDVAVEERAGVNIVVSTTFDYRGFDTLGEEYILFAAALGAVVLLRQQRGEQKDEEE